MTKELLEILRECKKAGIDKELASFQSFEDGQFTYVLERPEQLEHVFVFETTDRLDANIRVDFIIMLPKLSYINHKVYLDNECIGQKSVFLGMSPSDQNRSNQDNLHKLNFNGLDLDKLHKDAIELKGILKSINNSKLN